MSVEDSIYKFQPLLSLDKRGKTRFHKYFIRLVEHPGKISSPNWDFDDEKSVPITGEMLVNGDLIPSGYVAALWSETGIVDMKTMRGAPKYILSGKNLGKKNATNILTQAISEGTSGWNNKIKKSGYKIDLDDDNCSKYIKPMALSEFPPQLKDGEFKISGTNLWKEGDRVFVGRKIDGNRMMAMLDNGEVSLFGRSGDIPPNNLNHIRTQLVKLFDKYPDVILDGEIYLHGLHHQKINGLYMNSKKDASHLNYVLFDVIKLNDSRDKDTIGPFEKRMVLLNEIISSVSKSDIPSIYINEEREAETSEEIEQIYKAYLQDGYEGAVVRHADSEYEIGLSREIRSKRSIKLKPYYDSEYEIVGYKDGVGRSNGSIIWVLKMPDGREFNANPVGTLDERRKLFDDMKTDFDSKFKGRMMTITYTDKTNDGMPRFPRAKNIRD